MYCQVFFSTTPAQHAFMAFEEDDQLLHARCPEGRDTEKGCRRTPGQCLDKMPIYEDTCIT